MTYSTLLKVALLGMMLTSCGDNNSQTEAELKDPSLTHPPSEAIPDSTKLVADSVIMPDTTPNNGKQVGNSDSIQQNR